MKLNSIKMIAAACALALTASAVSTANAAMSRKPQDNLFYATSNEPLGLDPALVDDIDSGTLIGNMYESLLKFGDNDTTVHPSLAEKWEVSEDGKVYTFYLRKGVKFHDGTPFNAEAVKFNIDRQMPENMIPKMSYAPLVYGDVEKSEVVDEYTIRITLKQASTPFLRNMAMAYAAPIASPTALKKYNNNLMDHPCGTGPYKFVAWDRGQQIILTTNDDYWGEKPKIQNVIYRVMKDTSARVVALNNGEVDIINAIDANVMDQVKSGGNLVFADEGNSTNYLVFNTRDGYVTKDRDVRLALAQALDVPKIVEGLYKGYSTYAPTHMPSFLVPISPEHKPITYNPENAKKILAQKGVKKVRILTYSNVRFSNSVGGQVLAEALQEYFKRVGVDTIIDVYDFTAFKAKILTDNWDMIFYGWAGDNGDPDNFINILASDDPINNQGLWVNQEFRDLIKKAVTVPDGPERMALYQRAEDVIVEDVGVLPLSHPKSLLAYRPNLKNVAMHPIGITYFFKIEKK